MNSIEKTEKIFVEGVVAERLKDVDPAHLQGLERATAYLSVHDRQQLQHALVMAADAHAGQLRKSGELYITHPIAVAIALADQHFDSETLIAAILHDTLEDTILRHDEIVKQFGETVAELVDGVTKLDKLQFRSREEATAESFRKMLLAMACDLRVIMIKLADRVHNMRTLDAQPAEAHARIARETLDIYAPIAQRLGMSLIKTELQELGFRALHPWRYAVLEARIQSHPLMQGEEFGIIKKQLAQRLDDAGLQHRIVARVKTPWSIYSKMHVKWQDL